MVEFCGLNCQGGGFGQVRALVRVNLQSYLLSQIDESLLLVNISRCVAGNLRCESSGQLGAAGS